MEEVALGRFREDLYYRLNVVPIEMPPLRERGEDILMIARTFLSRFAEADEKSIEDFDADAIQKLLGYSWPGNVRQLQNVVRNALIFCANDMVGADDLPDGLMKARSGLGSPGLAVPLEARHRYPPRSQCRARHRCPRPWLTQRPPRRRRQASGKVCWRRSPGGNALGGMAAGHEDGALASPGAPMPMPPFDLQPMRI